MTDISSAKKRDILQRALDSREFKNKQKYRDLLTYLVECSLKGEMPKAISIAVDVFQRDLENLDSSFVRVYIHNLRDKLDKYYMDEGKGEELRIVIPKGHYDIRFVEIQNRKSRWLTHFKKRRDWAWGALVLSLGIFLLVGRRSQLEHCSTRFNNDPVWGDILDSETPLILNLGDEFLYEEYLEHYDDVVFVKNRQINTKKRMREYMQHQPDNRIIQWVESAYFADNCVYGLLNLLPFIVREGVEYTCNESDNVSMEYLVNNNVLFVGGHRTLYLLNDFLVNSTLGLRFFPEFSVGNSDTSLTPVIFHHEKNESSKQYDDYCMFLKLPGPRNNCLMVFTSYYGIGVRAVTKYLTEEASLNEFESIITDEGGSIPRYFITVFKVTGVGRYNCHIDVDYFQPVNEDERIW